MAVRALSPLEQAFVDSARTEASQEARRQAVLRGIYTNEGGEHLVYHGRTAANRSFLQGVGEIAKYGELLTKVDAETKKAIEDAVAETVGEAPECELPSAEDLIVALQAIQIAEREEAADAGGEAIKASLEAEANRGEGGAAARGGELRRQEGGRLSSRREGSRKARKIRGHRVQRGGAIGDFLKAFFRLTCGRVSVVAQQELAQRGRQGAVQAAIVRIENENPEYMDRVREQWKAKLATYAQRALLGAAAVDLAGPQYTIWAVTSLLTLLSSFIPNITLYGAAAGVLSGTGALVAGAGPIALPALNAYLGVSLTRAVLSRAMGGAQAARVATLQEVVTAARDRIDAFGALNSPEKRMAIEDGIARVNNAWLCFLSDVLFFGNQDLIFRIIGVPTPAEQANDAQILAEIRREAGAAAQTRLAAEAAWRERIALLIHPNRRAKIASAVAGDRMDRELRERFARADAAVQVEEAIAALPAAAPAQAALVAAVAHMNAGVGPNANNGNGAGAGARAGGLAGLARSMNRGPAAAYAGNLNLAALAGGEAPVGQRRPKRGPTTNAAAVLAASGSGVYEEDAGGGLGLPSAAGRGRAGSVVKYGKKKKNAGGGAGEERRNSTMMGGRRKSRASRKTRKQRKANRKH